MFTMSVSLAGTNLGLLTSYHGFDPSLNAFGSGEQSADFGQVPAPRTWSLAVNLTK